MRISDWSSYVCSSDLIGNLRHTGAQIVERRQGVALVIADKRVEIRSDFVVRVNVERAARAAVVHRSRADRKSTRLNSVTNAHLVCRLLLEKKKNNFNKKTHIRDHIINNNEIYVYQETNRSYDTPKYKNY